MSLAEQERKPAPWLVRLLLALVLVGPLVWLDGIYEFTDVPKGLLIQFGALTLLFFWLVSAVQTQELTLRTSQILLPLAACLAWAGVTLAYAHNRYEGVWILFRWLPALPIVVIGAAILRDPSWRRGLLMAIGVTGTLTALLGIIQALTGWSPVEQVVPPAASFANRNVAADFVVLTLSINIGWALDEPRIRRRLLALAATVVILAYLAMTCRMAWLSVAVQAVLWSGYLGWRAWGRRHQKISRRARWGVVLAVMAAVSLAAVFSTPEVRTAIRLHQPSIKGAEQPITQRIVQKGIESAGRIDLWLDTLTMIQAYPWLGGGLGNHKVTYPLYERHEAVLDAREKTRMVSHVHNEFLQLGAEVGLIGIFLLLTLFWAAGREYRANFARMLPGWPATTFGIAVAVVGGFLVSASFCFPLHRAGPPLVLAGFLAVIAASGPEKAVVVKKGRSLWAWGGAGAALMAAIMVAHLFWAWHFLQAERWYRLMVDADNQKRWKLVVGCGGEVLKHDPGRRRTLLYVGRALVASKHPTEAIAVFEEFLQAYPHHLNAWYNLGLAYSEAGDDINAIRAYREVLALNPDIALAHNNLGCIYLRRNELDEAEACFRAGVASEPRNALVWNNFGLTAVRRKDYAKAGHRFRRALTVNERYEAAHYKNLGVLYVQHLYPDRPQEGMSYLRRALQLDPNLPEAEEIRAMLRELEEKSAKKP